MQPASSRKIALMCAFVGSVSANLLTVAGSVGRSTCDFTVYYNRWIETFEKNEYKHNDGQGMHCLEACCRDPTCNGLELESDLNSQCYKSAHIPRVSDESGEQLLEFLAGERVSQWSVFVKTIHVPAPRTGFHNALPIMSDVLKSAIANRPRPVPVMVSEESLLDRRLRGVDPVRFSTRCEWTVYYDKWIPEFEHGEYAHDVSSGGAKVHCLQKCCEDPSCVGLSLESNELEQCYKYSQEPAHLPVKEGKRLGNGRWLEKQPNKWSVFIKATVPAVPAEVKSNLQTNSSVGVDGPSSFVAHSQASSGRPWLDDATWNKMHWFALGVILIVVLLEFVNKFPGGIHEHATLFELKARLQTGTERSPLLPAVSDESASRVLYSFADDRK